MTSNNEMRPDKRVKPRPKAPVAVVQGRTAQAGEKGDPVKRAQEVLQRFGYLPAGSFKAGVLDSATSEALNKYQAFVGLRTTGILDQATVDEMSRPRCGMPDILDPRRFYRFRGWDKLDLKFAFGGGTSDADEAEQKQAVRNAFASWAAVVPLTFREVSIREDHDFRISWVPANDPDHPQDTTFLAHSGYPPRNFEDGIDLPLPLHFNEVFDWAIGAVPSAFDIETTALHEIGHLLGLHHSAIIPSVMHVGQNPNSTFRMLQLDDIAAIQGLYTKITRVGDSADQAGEVSAIAAIKHGTQQILTAVRDGSNRLLLISWRVNDDGSVTRTGDSSGQAGELTSDGSAGVVSIARGARYVTAFGTSAGKLKLISWDVSVDGVITRAGDSGDVAGEARLIRVVALSDSLFVTACQNGSGNLFLISWTLNADGSISRLHDSGSAAGEVSEIALVDVSENNAGDRVLTAVRNGSGHLHLIVWSVAAGGAIQRLGQRLAGEATLIRAVRDSAGRVVTACRAGNDALKLIAWSIAPAAGVITRLFDSGLGMQTGEFDDIAFMSRPNGWLLTAVRNASGKLQLISWVIGGDPATLVRSQSIEQPTGEASLITLCDEPLEGIAPIVTAVRAGNDHLKLITWRD